jgi:hypothetical protein
MTAAETAMATAWTGAVAPFLLEVCHVVVKEATVK